MRTTLFLSLLFVLLWSCKSDKKDHPRNTTNVISNSGKALSSMDEMEEKVKELKDLTPMSNEDFMAWLPKEIDGMPRTNLSMGYPMMAEVSAIEAVYSNQDKSKEIKLNVIDRAGEMGAGATIGLTQMFAMNFDKTTNNGYKKTVTKNGIKAVEQFFIKQNRTELQMLVNNDRFYVHLEAKGCNPEQSWDIIDQFSFKNLE